MVTLDDEEMPLPKAAVRLLSADREKRKETWLAISEKRYSIKEPADQIYTDMLKLRIKIAENAGYSNFRDSIILLRMPLIFKMPLKNILSPWHGRSLTNIVLSWVSLQMIIVPGMFWENQRVRKH